MILESTPLSMPETKELLESLGDKEELVAFINKFSKLKTGEAKKIREEVEKIESLKIKLEHIIKIIDLMPEDASDIHKIFSDLSLDEDETKKILDVVKKYK